MTLTPESTSSAHCPQCGSPIPGGAPQGICPRCLLQNAMNPTVAYGENPAAPPQEIVRAFPHLEILHLVGAGGMGQVYKVRQPHLDRIAALKVLQPELAADPDFAERFNREGRALAKLSHPNIVTVFDFGKAGEFYWLLMEYVDGVNLRQAMQAGSMNPREALQIVPMICASLEYAHSQGVLHRDIKPENILIDTHGRVKIADFGVAKMQGEGRRVTLTLSGASLGTPAYMAPEQIERPQDVDHRADIYSLGVVFYELLTGELPLGRFLPPSEKAGTDPRLDTVVFRTLEKERDRRYQTAGEMKTQVENYSAAPAPRVRVKEERVSRKATWSVVLVMLGFLTAVGMVVTVRTDNQLAAPVRMETERVEARNGEMHLPQSTGSVGGNANMIAMRYTLKAGILMLGGTFLGWAAMRDIRQARGQLGGAFRAVLGGGFIPAVIVAGVSAGALVMLGEELVHGTGRRASPGWSVTGALAGIALAFLMLRKMLRYTLAWEPPVIPAGQERKLSACGTVAVCCTVAGAALTLVSILMAAKATPFTEYRELSFLRAVALIALVTGTTCGILTRREPAGSTCAFISGFLFVMLVLLTLL